MIDEAPITVPSIVVFEKATGKLLFRGPRNAPLPSDAYSWVPLPTGYSEEAWKWDATSRTMIESAALVEAQYIPLVKQEAARRKMDAISPGTAKPHEYKLKGDEAKASANVLTATLNALLPAAAMQQYPTAATEAQMTKEPLATVLARYRNGSSASDPEVRRIAAIEWGGKVAIKAATTAAAKRAAYAAINWAWKPTV